jgi:hypothetical protein
MHEVDSTTSKMDNTTAKAEYGGLTQRAWWETTFPAAYRHWRNRLQANGVTNVVYAINYAGFRTDSTAYTRTYPGDAYVDDRLGPVRLLLREERRCQHLASVLRPA